MNLIQKSLAAIGIGKIEILSRDKYDDKGKPFCCKTVELPVDKSLPVARDIQTAKRMFKERAIRNMFKLGDHIPAKERYTITMDSEDADKYLEWVSTICIDQVDKWRRDLGK